MTSDLVTYLRALDTAICQRNEARAEIERQARHIEELREKIDAEGSCACSLDAPGDICAAHSPALMRARAEVERLRDEDTKTRHALRGWVWVCPDGGDEPTHERVSAVVAEVERLTRERDESKSKETDYREGFDEGWAAAQKGAVDEVEKLRAALKFYAHEYCELGEAFEGCGKLLVEQCGGCLARAALEAKP